MFTVLFAVGCQDLEDTYDEFTGGGMNRYLGKCGDVEVAAGWERLRVVWKNNLDVGVKTTRITWKSENDAEPFVRYVERGSMVDADDLMDTIYLEGLADATYEVTVTNLAADSTESLATTLYARPYTTAHEDLRTFTRGITNFFPLDNKLVVILDNDNENLIEVTLHFWGTDGQEHEWNIKEHMRDSVEVMPGEPLLGYLTRDYIRLLPEDADYGIDFTKPLYVSRQGRLSGCIDAVPFTDEELDMGDRILSVGFTQWLTRKYGPDYESQLANIETVEFDYDMSTFQDLFYLPNLKKVTLGKNRFMAEGHRDENLSVTDDYMGLKTLQFLSEVRGVEVERYNNQYFNTEVESIGMTFLDALSMAAWMGGDFSLYMEEYTDGENMALMPDYTPLDTEGWEIECSDTTFNGYKTNGAGWLLDDDPTTYFVPGQTLGISVIEVGIDMKEAHTIHGFKVSQPLRATTSGQEVEAELAYLVSSIEIEVSEDNYTWTPATYDEGSITIGNAIGEVTFIEIPEALQSRNIRYIRYKMVNRHTSDISGGTPLYSLRLADVVPY